MPSYERGAPAAASNWTCGPNWLRRRSQGKLPRSGQQMSPSSDLVQRLGQEACLEGHRGCVNCLEWNSNGTLLASGSDDSNVIIWDAFRRQKQTTIKTGHEGPIFSVKFMPQSCDAHVATCAGDGRVKVSSVYQNESSLLNCNLCHTDRVKRLAVHPHEPNLIWSAAEDGLILQYDTRLEHVCNSSRPSNILVDLRKMSASDCLQAKCIAVNPLCSEMLAVGSNDIYNRLFDRRFVKQPNNTKIDSCIAYFAPGHLLKSNNRSNHIQTYGTTYLSFNSRGTQLLVSYHAEQIYLFDIREPWTPYQSFEQTIKPLLLDGQAAAQLLPSFGNHQSPRVKRDHLSQRGVKRVKSGESCWKLEKPTHMMSGYDRLNPSSSLSQNIYHLNRDISKGFTSPSVYCNRSEMLLKRGWRGDNYQALRDCCDALALDPMNPETIHQLAKTLVKMEDLDSSLSLAEFIRTHQSEYCIESSPNYLALSLEVLDKFQRESVHGSRSSLEDVQYSSMVMGSNNNSNIINNNNNNDDVVIDLKTLSDFCRQSKSESQRCSTVFDYSERFSGHCNMNTDIKEANFFGPNDEFIVGGSDDGAFYLWDRSTANIVKACHADHQILNCVQPNPNICMLATSGIETSVKLWSPLGQMRRDVKCLDTRCEQNQKFIATDPLEAMIMLLYPDTSENI